MPGPLFQHPAVFLFLNIPQLQILHFIYSLETMYSSYILCVLYGIVADVNIFLKMKVLTEAL